MSQSKECLIRVDLETVHDFENIPAETIYEYKPQFIMKYLKYSLLKLNLNIAIYQETTPGIFGDNQYNQSEIHAQQNYMKKKFSPTRRSWSNLSGSISDTQASFYACNVSRPSGQNKGDGFYCLTEGVNKKLVLQIILPSNTDDNLSSKLKLKKVELSQVEKVLYQDSSSTNYNIPVMDLVRKDLVRDTDWLIQSIARLENISTLS
ncbi:MAG: hypothetical protein MHPSP_004098, partial [Paramarteilia canceri]